MATQSFHIHRQMAELSFENGNYYWGWRFYRGSAHYLADLGNPFHVKALPVFFGEENTLSKRAFQNCISAIHQSYEVYVEPGFREGFGLLIKP